MKLAFRVKAEVETDDSLRQRVKDAFTENHEAILAAINEASGSVLDVYAAHCFLQRGFDVGTEGPATESPSEAVEEGGPVDGGQ